MTALATSSAAPADDAVFRFTVDQYVALSESGIIPEVARVELLEGHIYQKMSKNPPHSTAHARLLQMLPQLLPPGLSLRSEQPIALADGMPEPDLAIVRGPLERFKKDHPTADDVLLVIEISAASLVRDRSIKLRSYARAGIPHYWIVNVEASTVEVYSRPTRAGTYSDRTDLAAGATVALLSELGGRPLSVDALFPR